VLSELNRRGVGALVVSTDGRRLEGIVSERDVVRALDRLGAGILEEPVRTIMSSPVQTTTPSETVDSLAIVMTERRFRHVPVLEDGILVGIVSIGDVVKSRMGELEQDREALERYISSR
ncbi:MAG: histidine kinase, partial [Acidimicrobiaceae bacterium]|nr:histidine kinase [Acidimicrobiaceae bacterium]